MGSESFDRSADAGATPGAGNVANGDVPSLQSQWNAIKADAQTYSLAMTDALRKMDVNGNGTLEIVELDGLIATPGQSPVKQPFLNVLKTDFAAIAGADGDASSISDNDFTIVAGTYRLTRENELLGEKPGEFLQRGLGQMPRNILGDVERRSFKGKLADMISVIDLVSPAEAANYKVYAEYLDQMFPALADQGSTIERLLTGGQLSPAEADTSMAEANRKAVRHLYANGKLSAPEYAGPGSQLMDFIEKTTDMLSGSP